GKLMMRAIAVPSMNAIAGGTQPQISATITRRVNVRLTQKIPGPRCALGPDDTAPGSCVGADSSAVTGVVPNIAAGADPEVAAAHTPRRRASLFPSHHAVAKTNTRP